jgi:hypothetical protein
LRKHFKTILLCLILLIGISSVFIHPYGNVKAISKASSNPVFAGAQIEPQISGILQRSCQNCHSERTTWPWYSYVAPVSWMVESDVRDGRSHFNMSRWDEYNTDDRIQILAGISTMVRNKEMPLPQYLLLHRDAKLSAADIDLIYQWAQGERKRLKAEQKRDQIPTPATEVPTH